jgi:hypothetical protein
MIGTGRIGIIEGAARGGFINTRSGKANSTFNNLRVSPSLIFPGVSDHSARGVCGYSCSCVLPCSHRNSSGGYLKPMECPYFYRSGICINHIMLYIELHSNEPLFLLPVSHFNRAVVVSSSRIKRDIYVHRIQFKSEKNQKYGNIIKNKP